MRALGVAAFRAPRFHLRFEHRIVSVVSRRADLGVTPSSALRGRCAFRGRSGAKTPVFDFRGVPARDSS